MDLPPSPASPFRIMSVESLRSLASVEEEELEDLCADALLRWRSWTKDILLLLSDEPGLSIVKCRVRG